MFAGVRLAPDDEDGEHEHGVEKHEPPAAADRVVKEVDDESSELKVENLFRPFCSCVTFHFIEFDREIKARICPIVKQIWLLFVIHWTDMSLHLILPKSSMVRITNTVIVSCVTTIM